MNNNASKSTTALDGANFVELTSQENYLISGGTDPAPTGVWAGEDGMGCIPDLIAKLMRKLVRPQL